MPNTQIKNQARIPDSNPQATLRTDFHEQDLIPIDTILAEFEADFFDETPVDDDYCNTNIEDLVPGNFANNPFYSSMQPKSVSQPSKIHTPPDLSPKSVSQPAHSFYSYIHDHV